jgi:hypothetical protein
VAAVVGGCVTVVVTATVVEVEVEVDGGWVTRATTERSPSSWPHDATIAGARKSASTHRTARRI